MFSHMQPNWAEGLTSLLSLATLLAVVLAMIQVRDVNRQMHRELEMQYLLRFWQLMDRRSMSWSGKGRLKPKDRVVVLDYLTLSEDQIQLRALGRVTDLTWSYWRRDIRSMCGSRPIADELMKTSPIDFPHVRGVLASEDYDPLARSRIRRLWDGL